MDAPGAVSEPSAFTSDTPNWLIIFVMRVLDSREAALAALAEA